MPELPEVEITRRGLAGPLLGLRADRVVVRHAGLRVPVAPDLGAQLTGQRLSALRRRGKYLLLDFERGSLILHLGMSGSLRVVGSAVPVASHDHLDIVFGEHTLRLRDPRRFGLAVWSEDPLSHPLLAGLGIEPLDPGFTGQWLYRATRGRRQPIKLFLMDAGQVVGIGNIYASESLFRAGVRPATRAGRLGLQRCERLAGAVRETLGDALAAGGSTLRDFAAADGTPGYFQQQVYVYGRAGEPCRVCGSPIRVGRIGQRSTFHCPRCQK